MNTSNIISFFFLILGFSNLSAAVSSVADGAWSDPKTWSSGAVPGSGEDVVILHEVSKKGDLDATGGSLMVREGGALKVAGAITLKGFTDLTIGRDGLLECFAFRTYTTGGAVTVDGKLACTQEESGSGNLKIGGSVEMAVNGQISGKVLDVRGNAKVRIENEELLKVTEIVVRGNARVKK